MQLLIKVIVFLCFPFLLIAEINAINVGLVTTSPDQSSRMEGWLADFSKKSNKDIVLTHICPNYSFENPLNAYEDFPYGFRTESKERGLHLVKNIKSLTDSVDIVVLYSPNGRLDFNAAVQILTAGKDLILEQPEIFELKDMIILFALSKKYQVNMMLFEENTSYVQLLNSRNIEVSAQNFNNKHTVLLYDMIKNDLLYIDQDNLYYEKKSTDNEQLTKIKLKDENKWKEEIYLFLTSKKSRVSEREFLNLSSLFYSIYKSREMKGTSVNVDEEFLKAFDQAYEEMKIFN